MSQDGAHGRYAGGSIAGGRYQLRDLLGEGGMASVYLAYDSALDRLVAIKTLHTELGREQSFRERFRREAQAVAKLQHTNIVSVFDTGEDTVTFSGSAAGGDGVMPYIVMEYVEGEPLGSTLHKDIQQYGAMPADKALKVTADVLAALEVSHEMGLVHRDIKPGNVMMTKRGLVKVMDFGIARAMQSGVTSMTQTGMVVGTPQYLSPEQALGRGVDARSDLYSVGIMLFQLLTGRIPFDADSPLAIAYAHVQEEPVAPSAVNRSITPAMDALVARALKKNPNERFPSAQAMHDEILRIASSGQMGAAPVITGGAPLSSGAGVGSTVFPPLDSQAAPGLQGNVQTPYQAGPYGPPTPTPTPATPTPQPQPQPSYGYPQAQQPAPMAAQTPPPYTISPAQTSPAASGGSKRNTPVIVGSVAVALLAVGGLVTALMLNNNSSGGSGGDAKSSSSAPAAGHKPPERSRTMDSGKCTSPQTSTLDPGKVQAPDFTYKDILSVKSCLQAAGWKVNVEKVDNGQWGEDVVVTQFPAAGTDVDKKEAQFSLQTSTGNAPAQ
ncbi:MULTISPECIES: protein kinase [unclassified Streptomyces]|uniref:protein kinase domain-containing protein n=1 Tax=unclassified Streptomyces TaxID=2593676 RepID=UPI003801B621